MDAEPDMKSLRVARSADRNKSGLAEARWSGGECIGRRKSNPARRSTAGEVGSRLIPPGEATTTTRWRFCKLLREWWKQAGLTQRELAERLRKPPSYVHKTEVAARRIDPLEFFAWCRECERDPAAALLEAAEEAGF